MLKSCLKCVENLKNRWHSLSAFEVIAAQDVVKAWTDIFQNIRAIVAFQHIQSHLFLFDRFFNEMMSKLHQLLPKITSVTLSLVFCLQIICKNIFLRKLNQLSRFTIHLRNSPQKIPKKFQIWDDLIVLLSKLKRLIYINKLGIFAYHTKYFSFISI